MKIFVYGTLKRGFGNHRIIDDAEFVAETTAPGKLYDLGAFPAATYDANSRIHGEVFEVNDRHIRHMDRLEGHPSFYRRTPVKLDNGMDAEIYYFNDERVHQRAKPLESGRWPV